MFNPVTKVCDWPLIVMHLRPMCDPRYSATTPAILKKVDFVTKEHKSTTTATTTMSTTTTTTTPKRVSSSTNPKIIYILPVNGGKKKAKPAKKLPLKSNEVGDMETDDELRRKKSVLSSNGLFDILSLKVFTRDNVTRLSSP